MSKEWLFLAALGAVCFVGCSDDSSSVGSTVNATCGNQAVERTEACDDGNTESGDGCTADCSAIEEGYTCPSSGGACTKKGEDEPKPEPEPDTKPKCGNGKVETGEECDDGNTDDGDGCSSDCHNEGCSGDGCHENLCGNSELDLGEACDDGNTDDGDGCSADCTTIEPGFNCLEAGQDCIPEGCGNQTVEGEEECDEGDYAVPYGEGGCTPSCKFAHYCGDGLWDEIDIENGEECDDGADTSDQYPGCTAECKRVNVCGDGTVQTDHEKCDDGNLENGDGCSSTCEIEPNYVCVTTDGKSICTSILCGNGQIDGTEACDDGNRTPGDGCSQFCMNEPLWRCELDAQGKSKCEKTCGNSTL
ncbi:MAG: DUF4215 domain-containing protein, partial [Proteobacteria bacterium]|nr:DUF4215 domain-containing protein [Pseudomonadota bacterium]